MTAGKPFNKAHGKLSMVATPIGNLEDVTLRALRVLRETDVVAAEDTRVTKKLLAHYDIHTPLVSFHANSGAKGFIKIVKLLEEGRHVALVSDAGTPGVSDPGLELVSVVRDATVDNSITIETVPGPSALTAALAVAGLKAPTFTFYGFLPLKKGRETLLAEMARGSRASVFFESPHRICKTLERLTALAPERRIGVFRELTKMYEEAKVGFASSLLPHFQNPQKQKGEFVVIVEGK